MDIEESLIRQAAKRVSEKLGSGSGKDCLGEDMLVQYCEGLLDAIQVKKIQKHLSACRNCLEILVEFQGLRQVPAEKLDLDVPEQITNSAIELVERMTHDTVFASSSATAQTRTAKRVEPAESLFDVVLQATRRGLRILKRAMDIDFFFAEAVPMPVRGPTDRKRPEGEPGQEREIVSFVKELGEMTAETRVVRSAEGVYSLSVRVCDRATGRAFDGVRVTLSDLECALESLRTEEGSVCFEGYEEGSYFLEIKGRDASAGEKIALKIVKSD